MRTLPGSPSRGAGPWVPSLLFLCPHATALAEQAVPGRPRIVPSGIEGALVLCGSGDVSAEALGKFVDFAGSAKARVVVLRTSDAASPAETALTQHLRERLEALKAPA